MELDFRPINNWCVDCHGYVSNSDRQEIAWDDEGQCRRMCAKCLIKFGIEREARWRRRLQEITRKAG